MHVYYYRFYWPSNLLFVVRCVTYISNLRKLGQKLSSLSGTIGISDRQTDRHTYTRAILRLWLYTDIVSKKFTVSVVGPELIGCSDSDVVDSESWLEEIPMFTLRVAPVASGVRWKRTVKHPAQNNSRHHVNLNTH